MTEVPAKMRFYIFLEKLETRSHKGHKNEFEHKILASDRIYFSQLKRYQAASLVEWGLRLFTLPMVRRFASWRNLIHQNTKFDTS